MSQPEQHGFQAEIQQLLELVVHSLYTDRDIFLRELISNASDAMEKLKLIQATEKDIVAPELGLEISISADKEAGTLTIEDHGIGLTREELIENLGTIAHSGTKAFLQSMKESGTAPKEMIGQFGVGFYSAFMVAEEVTVITRSWQQEGETLAWTSDGTSGFTIESSSDELQRGTKIILKLKEDAKEFAEDYTLTNLVNTYSSFVGFPVMIAGKRVNEIEALWLKNKSEISDEEYKAFYQFQAKAFDDPLLRLHFSADAPLAINALLYVPSQNPERMGFGQIEPGVALYCKKVLIDPQPKGLLPEWLRFVKGVIDSADLPLNISRESMQDSALVHKISKVITSRFIKMLEKEAKSGKETWQTFYKTFDRFLKEGVATDYTHRAALTKLLRFESTHTDAGKQTGLDDYLSRAKDGQEEIYYLLGGSRSQIEASPYLEGFRKRGLEVLYFTDPIDEYMADSLAEYEGKKFVSITKANVSLEDTELDGESLSEEESKALCEFLQKEYGDRVTKVESGQRLVDSPAVALLPEDSLSPQMRAMMRAMDENFDDTVKVEIEINPRHEIIRKLAAAVDSSPEMAKLVAAQLLDNALISAGLLENAQDTIKRMNQLMQKALS